MTYHRLHASQFLPVAPEKAWAFFSDPANLKRITPEYMNFEILSGADQPMYPGQIIQYRVSPFPGVRTTWVSEISHVDPGRYFVDEQRFGPYSFWHHKHFLHPEHEGVRVEDVVDYKLPYGILGKWVNAAWVRTRLEAIFSFRAQALEELFGPNLPGYPASQLTFAAL